MSTINCNIKYFFKQTDENYLFGKGGLIWRKTLGRISCLANKIFSKNKQGISPSSSSGSLKSFNITAIDSSKNKAVNKVISDLNKKTVFKYEDNLLNPNAHKKNIGNVFQKLKNVVSPDEEALTSEKAFEVLGSDILGIDSENGKSLNRVDLTINDKSVQNMTQAKEILEDSVAPENRPAITTAVGQNLLTQLCLQLTDEIHNANKNLEIMLQQNGNGNIRLYTDKNEIKIFGTKSFNLMTYENGKFDFIGDISATIFISIPDMQKFNENDSTTFRCSIEIDKARAKFPSLTQNV